MPQNAFELLLQQLPTTHSRQRQGYWVRSLRLGFLRSIIAAFASRQVLQVKVVVDRQASETAPLPYTHACVDHVRHPQSSSRLATRREASGQLLPIELANLAALMPFDSCVYVCNLAARADDTKTSLCCSLLDKSPFQLRFSWGAIVSHNCVRVLRHGLQSITIFPITTSLLPQCYSTSCAPTSNQWCVATAIVAN